MNTVLSVPIYVLSPSTHRSGPCVGVVEIRPYRAYNAPKSAPGIVFVVHIVHAPLGAGTHGFHIHENPDLRPTADKGKLMLGGAAGPHFDPQHTGMHLGPYAAGHLGDLPALTFDVHGNCMESVYAPRLRMSDVRERALIIHHGPDNYSDYPEVNGGSCDRRLGGVIP